MKILVEKAVIEQALEALKKYADWRCTPETDQTITALREALAVSEQRMEEQTEQEPIENNDWKKASYIRETLNAEQAEQEPVAWVEVERGIPMFMNFTEDYKPYINNGIAPLYAAPVRTKDLTDDEIAQAVGSPLDEVYLADFRAVIAKFKEKNK